jgi:hypothetical protein
MLDSQLNEDVPTTIKMRWQPPSITFLGDVKLLVRGGGKSASQNDSDPQGTAKSGVG